MPADTAPQGPKDVGKLIADSGVISLKSLTLSGDIVVDRPQGKPLIDDCHREQDDEDPYIPEDGSVRPDLGVASGRRLELRSHDHRCNGNAEQLSLDKSPTSKL